MSQARDELNVCTPMYLIISIRSLSNSNYDTNAAQLEWTAVPTTNL